MSDNNKMTGRKIDREKWDWKDHSDIKQTPEEVIKKFEDHLDQYHQDQVDLEQGRSRARREDSERTIALALVLGGGFFVGWMLVELIIKFVI
jgi:hypothetical protein